ncbi:MAG: hypothetical protein GX167_07630 [Firmicutes bacterium]|nr:hypothetical protein [Bacillota bacterium]
MIQSGIPDAKEQYLEAVTGWTFTMEDSYRTGLRILNMRHAFNLREDLKPADFTLFPRAAGKPPLAEGPLAGVEIDTEQLAKNFFLKVEWDMVTGKPSLESLQRLGGLDDVIRDLYY